MASSDSIRAKAGGRKTIFLLLFFALLITASPEALACQAFVGLIDGFVDAPPTPPHLFFPGWGECPKHTRAFSARPPAGGAAGARKQG